MENTLWIAIVSGIFNVILGLMQFKNYKAQAGKTNTESATMVETADIAREKHIFDMMQAYNLTAAEAVLKQQATNEILLEKNEKLRHERDNLCKEKLILEAKLEKCLENCPDLKNTPTL